MADARVEEDDGAVLSFAVTLSRAASGALTVDYATSDGSAQAGVDYTAASGTLTFQAGESSRTIEVSVLDDSHDDDGETLTLTLSNPSSGRLTDGEATGTIENRLANALRRGRRRQAPPQVERPRRCDVVAGRGEQLRVVAPELLAHPIGLARAFPRQLFADARPLPQLDDRWVGRLQPPQTVRVGAQRLARLIPSLRPSLHQQVPPSAGRHRQGPDPLEHRPEQAAGQVAFGQQEPVVAGMFH